MHLPDASLPLHERLSIQAPPQGTRKSLPSWTTWQQEQEWLQLRGMATAPSFELAGAANGASPGGDPVDRLASWLFSQAQLTGPGPAR